MNVNPIKLLEFNGEFVPSKAKTNLYIEKEISTVHLNLHSGTWQCCVKSVSFICENDRAQLLPMFFDITSNLLYEENPSELNQSKVDVVLFRFLCQQGTHDCLSGDTWFNVTKPTLSPRLLIKCHNLKGPKVPAVNITLSVLLAFRRVL